MSCAYAIIPSVNVEGKIEDLEQKLKIVLQNVMAKGYVFRGLKPEEQGILVTQREGGSKVH